MQAVPCHWGDIDWVLLHLQEVARVLGALGKDTCPLRDTALSSQYLPKILAQLKRALQVGPQ
jgi:hypothetical protein